MTVPGVRTESEWRLFEHPVLMLQADAQDEMAPLLLKLDDLTDRGFYAVGFFAYETCVALDPELHIQPDPGFPLAQFAVFDHEPEVVVIPEFQDCPPLPECRPEWSKEEYFSGFAQIHRNIVAGNIYQANLTFRAGFDTDVPPEELFLALYSRHPVPYAAFLNDGKRKIVSLSPELFLESDGQHIFSNPMKETAKRLPDPAADLLQAQWLANDEKKRAENLMITDMVRNDLGRICRPGSVRGDPLFRVDTYRTVHQMISTVHGELSPRTSLFQIMKATFPPASITGAPKISAVNLIARCEKSPRGIYTGSIGCFLPRRRFRLNVAIRTLLFENDTVSTGIGGGVVYDSTPEDEWNEALLKCRYASADDPDFQVFETLLWTPHDGFLFGGAHIRRATTSQRYFGRRCPDGLWEAEFARIQKILEGKTPYEHGASAKIIVDRDGQLKTIITTPRLPDWRITPLNVLVSARRVDSSDVFLYHKTSRRKFFDAGLAEARAKGFDEVFFLNENDELTEGSISNIFLRKNGVWLTPAVECGLLAGIWRAEMLRKLCAREAHLHLRDFEEADKILCGNSLRGSGEVSAFLVEGRERGERKSC